METVKAFNSELTALYEGKPPISRAKMAQLTKSAIKGIKFYKHVVQSVEKFIQKCRPEYKIPGLYVIDSIVRSSRHQFGGEKDVFAPRFSKNIVQTIQHVLKCSPEERPKVIRVLNLWQKNTVYSPAVIQPLLDLAADTENPDVFQQAVLLVQDATGLEPTLVQPKQKSRKEKAVSVPVIDDKSSAASVSSAPAQDDDLLKAVSQLLQQTQEPQQLTLSAQESQLRQLQLLQEQLVQQSKILAKPAVPQAPLIDSGLLTQIQALTNQLLGETQEEKSTPTKTTGTPAFNKKLLDFDYGESDEEENRTSPMGQTKTNMTGDHVLPKKPDSVDSHHKTKEEVKPEVDSHRHRMMQEEYDDAMESHHSQPPARRHSEAYEEGQEEEREVEEDLDQVEFDEDIRRPREPPHPPEPAGYPEDSFDGQVSQDASRDYSREGYSHDQEDGEYEEGEYVEEDVANDSFNRDKADDSFQGSYSRQQEEEYVRPERERPEGGYKREKSKKSSRKRDREKREAEETTTKVSRGKDRERQRDEDRRRERDREEVAEEGYSRKEKKVRELPFGPSREYFEQTSKKHRRKDRSRSKSRSRTPKRKKRSRSREKKKRSRSKSKERRKRSRSRDKDKERKRREKVREKIRRENGLPPLKEDHVAVCSTTLWIGHLSRHTTEDVLRKELENYGKDPQISLVLPRGCAFVCLGKRKDAATALIGLRGVRLLGNSLKADWAPGKGIKESKSYSHKFDKELGAIYVPYSKLHKVNLKDISEGGMIDEESLPSHMRTVIHIDMDDEEPVETHEDPLKSDTEDVVVGPEPPQSREEDVQPALPPEPVPAPPEPELPPTEIPKPLPPNDLGMLPQPVMPAMPAPLVTSRMPYPAAMLHTMVTPGSIQVPGMVPPPMGIPLPTLGVVGLPSSLPPVTTAGFTEVQRPSDLAGTTPINDEPDEHQSVDTSIHQQVSDAALITQDLTFAGVGHTSTRLKTPQSGHPTGDNFTDMEYDPSQPSEDNTGEMNQESKAAAILASVTLPKPGESDGFLPLVRARSVRKTPKKAATNLESPFSGTGLMNKKKGISIVIDEWKKKNLGDEKSEEALGKEIGEVKSKDEIIDVSADDSYEEHLWKSEAETNTSTSLGQCIPTISTLQFPANEMSDVPTSEQAPSLDNICLPPTNVVDIKRNNGGTSYPVSTSGPYKTNPDNRQVAAGNMNIFTSSSPNMLPSNIPLPFPSSSAPAPPQSLPYPPSPMSEPQNMPRLSSVSAPSEPQLPTAVPPSIPLPSATIMSSHHSGTAYQGQLPPPGFICPPPIPPSSLYNGSGILHQPAQMNPNINFMAPVTQGNNTSTTPVAANDHGLNFGPGAKDQDLRRPFNQNQLSGPRFSSTDPPFSSSGPPFSSTGPHFSSAAPPFSSGGPTFTSSAPPYSSAGPPFSSTGPTFSSTGPPFGVTAPTRPGSENNVPPFPSAPVSHSGRGPEPDRYPGKGSSYYDEGDNSSQSSSQYGELGGEGPGSYRMHSVQESGENRGHESPNNMMDRDGSGDWNNPQGPGDDSPGFMAQRNQGLDQFGEPRSNDSQKQSFMGGQGGQGPPPMGANFSQAPKFQMGDPNRPNFRSSADNGPPSGNFGPGPFGNGRNQGRNNPGNSESQGPPRLGDYDSVTMDNPELPTENPYELIEDQQPQHFNDEPAMGGHGNQGPQSFESDFEKRNNQPPFDQHDRVSGQIQGPRFDGPSRFGGPQGPSGSNRPRFSGPGSQAPGMGDPRYPPPIGGPGNPIGSGNFRNQGPLKMGGSQNSGPPGMGGQTGPGNFGPPGMGGPQKSGPQVMGGPQHLGLQGMGGPQNPGPPNMVGPQNSGPPGMGGPQNSGPPGMGGPQNSGPPGMGGPQNSGPPGMGGPQIPGMGGPQNSGSPGMGGPRHTGSPGMGGLQNSGPQGMGGPRHTGPPGLGGPQNSGPPGIGGPRNSGPLRMGGPRPTGPPGMGGPQSFGPQGMGGPQNSGPVGMGGPQNSGPQGMGGPQNSGPMGIGGSQISGPLGMGGPVNSGPLGIGGPRHTGPPGMGGPRNSGPQAIGGPQNSGPMGMGGPQNSGPQGMGGPLNSGPQGMGGPQNSGPMGIGGPQNLGPRGMGGPQNFGSQEMGGPGNHGPQRMGDPGNRPPHDMGGPQNPPPFGMGAPGNQGRPRMDGPGGPNIRGPNSQMPADMQGPRMGGPGNRPHMMRDAQDQGPPNFRDRNFSSPGDIGGPRPNRPFGDGPPGRFEGHRDHFSSPGEFNRWGNSDFPEGNSSRNFGQSQFSDPAGMGDNGPSDRPPNFNEPRMSEPFSSDARDDRHKPNIPSLLDSSEMSGFGSRSSSGPPSAGKKYQIAGLMSIGPSLIELGVDMDAAKRDAPSEGPRNTTSRDNIETDDKANQFGDPPPFNDRDSDNNFDRRERGRFGRRDSDGHRDGRGGGRGGGFSRGGDHFNRGEKKFDRRDNFGGRNRDNNERRGGGARGRDGDRFGHQNRDRGGSTERGRIQKGKDEFGRIPRQDSKFSKTPTKEGKDNNNSSAKKQYPKGEKKKKVPKEEFTCNDNDVDDFDFAKYDKEMEEEELKEKNSAGQNYDIDNWGDDNFLRDNWGEEKSVSHQKGKRKISTVVHDSSQNKASKKSSSTPASNQSQTKINASSEEQKKTDNTSESVEESKKESE